MGTRMMELPLNLGSRDQIDAPPRYNDTENSTLVTPVVLAAPPPAYQGKVNEEGEENSHTNADYTAPNYNHVRGAPAPTLNANIDDYESEPEPYPNWVKVHLNVARVTLFVMILAAIGSIVFAGVVSKDLKDDYDDSACSVNYIRGADLPPNNKPQSPTNPGRHHAQCRLLYTWSLLLTAAAVLSILRPFFQGIIYVNVPNKWRYQPSPGNRLAVHLNDFLRNPSNAYGMRAFSSLVIAVLYLVCGVLLATSPLITGSRSLSTEPSAEFRNVYKGCLALIWVSFVVTAHQVFASGMASWYVRKWWRVMSLRPPLPRSRRSSWSSTI